MFARLTVLLGAALIAAPLFAQEVHTPFCLYGCPQGAPPTNDLIVRSIYALSSNDETKFADWVAYRVTKQTIGRSKERVWRADPALASDETLEPSDYNGANSALSVDRGHQVPLASFTSTDEWEATNYLSNITPQKSALNQGPWERLESAERKLAQVEDVNAVFVLTGPLYERPMPELPGADEPHRIPSGYWKIVAVETRSEIRAAGFIMDQDTPRSAQYCEYLVTIGAIEGRSRFKFFPDLRQQAPDRKTSLLEDPPRALGCD